jgi:hypothetical protein
MIQLAIDKAKSILNFLQNVEYLSHVCEDVHQAEDVMITSFEGFTSLKTFNTTV